MSGARSWRLDLAEASGSWRTVVRDGVHQLGLDNYDGRELMAERMSLDIRLLGPADGAVLERVAPDVFDSALDEAMTAEFLSDPRHHLAAAIDDGLIVGMASAVHYVH